MKMKPIDWYVYRLLEERTYQNDTTVSQREIYDACRNAGFELSWNDTQNQHHDHCRPLHDIVQRINGSMEVDKIVIHHCYNYRLANADEAYELYKRFDERIKLASKRRSAIRAKMKRHLQGKLLTNQLKEMDGSPWQKEFHEAFNNVAGDYDGD